MKYRESEEMYLETILLLTSGDKKIRSIDIANYLNYSRASVSRAIGLLKKNEYIEIDDNCIFLTPNGLDKAKSIYERHNVITNVLVKLGVSEDVAEENACRIEHVISDDVVEKFKEFLQNSQ